MVCLRMAYHDAKICSQRGSLNYMIIFKVKRQINFSKIYPRFDWSVAYLENKTTHLPSHIS